MDTLHKADLNVACFRNGRQSDKNEAHRHPSAESGAGRRLWNAVPCRRRKRPSNGHPVGAAPEDPPHCDRRLRRLIRCSRFLALQQWLPIRTSAWHVMAEEGRAERRPGWASAMIDNEGVGSGCRGKGRGRGSGTKETEVSRTSSRRVAFDSRSAITPPWHSPVKALLASSRHHLPSTLFRHPPFFLETALRLSSHLSPVYLVARPASSESFTAPVDSVSRHPSPSLILPLLTCLLPPSLRRVTRDPPSLMHPYPHPPTWLSPMHLMGGYRSMSSCL